MAITKEANMNKFLWKVENTCLDYTPVTIIKNAITKKQAAEIAAQVKEYSQTEHSKEFQKFNEDNNPGCWRGFPLIAPDDVPGLTRENKTLIQNVIREGASLYQDSWPNAPRIQVTRWQRNLFEEKEYDVSIWFNINQKGAANQIHNHHGAFFSGVFYFQAEGTGPLTFYPHNFLTGHTHPMWPYKGAMFHYPDDGDLVLFPAHLSHDVVANPIDKERINCAFNVALLPKQVPN